VFAAATPREAEFIRRADRDEREELNSGASSFVLLAEKP
jgi:hypothetical protein